MGITKLWPELAPCAKEFSLMELEEVPWLLDFSCMMRIMMAKPAVLCEFFEAGKDDNRAFRDECRSFLGGLINVKVKPIVVFDGKRSKIKDEEGAKRDQKRRKAREEINNLQTVYHGDSGSREQFLKLARQAMDLSELFMSIAIQVCKDLKVEFVGAPFEADFQLVEEQLARKIGDRKLPYILTLDSDLLVLGDNIIRYEPHKFSNISEQTRVQLYMQKKIWSDFHTGRIGTSKSTDFYFNNVTWCLFACLIGNDYTKWMCTRSECLFTQTDSISNAKCNAKCTTKELGE